jgi:ABC-type multidrug transport system fused ATPase/permease subunit
MSHDVDDDVPSATETWRDYLREMRESLTVYRWAVGELVAPEAWPCIRQMVAFMCLMTVLSAVQPWTTKFVIDGLMGRNAPSVLFGLSSLGLCLAGKALFDRAWASRREVVLGENNGRIDARTTELFFSKALGQHLHEGDVLSASNVERGRANVLALQNLLLFEGLGVLLNMLLCYACLWFVSAAASAIMGTLLIIHLFWMVYFNANINRVCVPIEKDFRALNRWRADRWQFVERVKTCGMEQAETDELKQRFRSLIGKDRAFWLWLIGRDMWSNLMNYAALVLVACYGAHMVWTDKWEIGTLFPLLSWCTFVIDNLWRISRIEQQLNWNAPSVRSMMRALSMEPNVMDGTKELPDASDGIRVQFENVACSYPDQDGNGAHVLHHVSFEIPPRGKVALIGPSGAGKSTLMRLLFRASDPSEGRVLVNNRDLRDLRLGSWLKQVGYIAQQPQVFDGTIRDNLLFAADKAQWPDEKLWPLMRRLSIDFGKRLTNGLDTRVGRGGLRLSGGQAQRLMIGAAVARKPRLMVIDEATSSLDSTTERDVQRGLAECLGADVGALIVTHRLSTVRDLCDSFVVLRPSAETLDGMPQVEAVAASFEELYAISPTFRRLADDQGVAIASPRSP